MNEQVLRFGPNETLLGILTQPSGARRTHTPVALILNAGVVHRVGPFRLHVDLARSLADRGYTSLRMDLSGLGDSEVRKELPDEEDRAMLDINDALDALEQKLGVSEFVPMGLCSGAYNSHQVCVASDRLTGGVFLDGIAYETEGHSRRRIQRRMGFRFLRNALKKRIVPDVIPYEETSEIDSAEFFTNDKEASEVAAEIQAMLDRRMRLLFIYTGGNKEFSSVDQFKEMFSLTPNGRELQVDYYKDYEHTFRLTPNRDVIVRRISEWFMEQFPIGENRSVEGHFPVHS
ncbi:MAG: hypothetical protein AAGJ83_00180 [Planctomycetota bacterium]